ncbi:hypothetical protein CN692_24240 [Bacillus sp. AFS002410]|uniref:hypothetical protein n=1 Tax=Bacillus sp. AFS002410 TaxID=2033481 RepID=UPI000BEF772B|nr:hypothetical protein [Bacillus sp. AFS002410]PEJ48220.1 hypothetical protein CN692_24240 [Bacillus sp. AFS002410]
MNLVELKNILKATGFPVAYYHFDTPPKPPYICYLVDSSSNFHADNEVFHKISNVNIELYTKKKDLDSERIIESLLDENDIPYDSSEVYIDSEKLFQKFYEVRLI